MLSSCGVVSWIAAVGLSTGLSGTSITRLDPSFQTFKCFLSWCVVAAAAGTVRLARSHRLLDNLPTQAKPPQPNSISTSHRMQLVRHSGSHDVVPNEASFKGEAQEVCGERSSTSL